MQDNLRRHGVLTRMDILAHVSLRKAFELVDTELFSEEITKEPSSGNNPMFFLF